MFEATAYHHHPERKLEAGFSPLTAVHVANVLDHEANPHKIKGGMPEINVEYIEAIGLHSRLNTWKELAGQPQVAL